jgi:STE24 endopeptidase
MPVPLLIALFLAFGLDAPRDLVPEREVSRLMLQALVGVVGVGLASVGLGSWVAWRVAVYGYMTSRTRRLHQVGSRLLVPLALGVYGWLIFGLGWRGVVETAWGLKGWFLVGQLAILAPFLLMQVLIWCGSFLVERALLLSREPDRVFRLGTYLLLRSRTALGLILPVVLVFIIRHDVIGRIWPEWTANEISEPIDFAILGAAILFISPLFIRLAFPTRSLPEGPLRQRLEHLGRRVGFRFRDILVWDTDHGMVNACVTGVLPGYRYVLLTDSLIETLEPREISAVFGHEIGHIAHRHLPYFGFFFLGSLGILTLAGAGASGIEHWLVGLPTLSGVLVSSWANLIETGLVLAAVAGFFGIAFGHLSRRFERQADVFGCTVVSCEHPDCPPHDDPDDEIAPVVPGQGVSSPCPAGIRIFANALERVARHNGMELRARSWRHGSIASRIAFVESLRDDPARAVQFQLRIRRLRFRWGILLVGSILVALGAHAFSIIP